MTLGLIEILLILLVVSTVLGVAGTVRRSRTTAARTPDRPAYVFCAAMVCCALVGVWRYFEYRRAVSQQSAASQKRLEQFVTPRALRIRSAEPLEFGLTFVVTCKAFGNAARREVCASRGVLSERTLTSATRDELLNRFVGSIEIGLSPAQRITHDDDEPLLRYLAQKDDVTGLTLVQEPDKNYVAITVRRARATAIEPSVSFIDADSADMRVSLRSDGCAAGACEMKRLSLVVDHRSLCADRLRRSIGKEGEVYAGRIHRCLKAQA